MPNNWLKKYASETSKRKPNAAKNKAVRQTGRRGGAGAKVYVPPDKTDDVGWTCKECENEFTNVDDKVIGCDSCTSYYCIECIEMTEKEYKVLHRPDCFWRCPTCTIENEENKHWQKEIVREIEAKFEGKITELEKRMDEKLKKYSCDLTQELPRKVNETWADHVKTSDTASNVKNIVKEVITEKKKEEVDKEQREANLIIYRAKESNKENSEERQNEDKQFFDALCNDILGIGPVKTKNIIRLGKKNDLDDEQKPPRPLKIVLEDKIYRNKVLQNCDKLGEAEDLFKNISVSPDYNKDEREKIRALATEAKKKSEEDLNFVYRVRGPPWNLRLKKFAKR